jgi:hypothetical protein
MYFSFTGVNENGRLVPGYLKSRDTPEGTLLDIECSPLNGMDKQILKYFLVITQLLKAISFETVRFVEVSPQELHALAGSIPKKPYCVGTNDCQTWFLDALRKLQFYEVGDKDFEDCAFDTLRAPCKVLTNTTVKATATVTNAGLQAINTVGRVFSLQEDPATAIVDGTGKTVNHVISGVSETTAGAVDGVAGFAVNAIGLVTGGGCATKNGLGSDMKNLSREVLGGKMSLGEGFLKASGKTVGNVVYGAANITTNTVDGVAKTATGLVSGVTGTVTAPFRAVDRVASKVIRGDMHPVEGVVLAPVVVAGAVLEGVGTTVVNVGAGIGNTIGGIFKGFASIF